MSRIVSKIKSDKNMGGGWGPLKSTAAFWMMYGSGCRNLVMFECVYILKFVLLSR